jgi:hypothetical protein
MAVTERSAGFDEDAGVESTEHDIIDVVHQAPR